MDSSKPSTTGWAGKVWVLYMDELNELIPQAIFFRRIGDDVSFEFISTPVPEEAVLSEIRSWLRSIDFSKSRKEIRESPYAKTSKTSDLEYRVPYISIFLPLIINRHVEISWYESNDKVPNFPPA